MVNLIITVAYVSFGVSVTSVPFEDMSACLAAGRTVAMRNADSKRQLTTETVCAPMGTAANPDRNTRRP